MFNKIKLKIIYQLLKKDPDNIQYNEYFEKISNAYIQATQSDNEVNFKDLEFAISFSPEQLEYIQNQDQYKSFKKISNLEFLDFITDKLNIKNIRLGLRWNLIDKEGKLDLGDYEEIIRYCIEKDLKIVLNIGPIKTFRWPEVYVPEYIINKLNLENINKFRISSDMDISKESRIYLEKLFELLNSRFGENFFNKIYAIQPENELFNPFGERLWTLDKSHIFEVTKIIHKYFPNSRILFSASGDINESDITNPDIFKLQNLIRFLSENISINLKFIIGLNYYYRAPGFIHNSYNTILDNFSRLEIVNGNNIFKNLKEFAMTFNTEIEISELQFEPWEEVLSPGSSINEFKFQIIRLENELGNLKNIPIRLWGAELLAKRFYSHESKDSEIMEIIKLIQER